MKIPIALVALVTGLSVVTGSAAVAGPSATGAGGTNDGTVKANAPATPPPTAPPPVQQGAQQRPVPRATVTLLTGDKIKVDPMPNGDTNVTPVSTTLKSAADFTKFSWHGDAYVIPDSAVPYLASTLDMRLFDVSYLARAGLDDAHQASLPVTVTTGGAAAPALPSVHATHQAGASTSATVDKKTAGQFGRHLAQQWRDSKTGASSTPVGKLAGVTRISLSRPAGAPPLPPAPPSTPQQATAQATASGATTAAATTQNATQVAPHA